MLFFLVIIALVIVSVFLALLSYRNVNKVHEVHEVKTELAKGKVVYQHDKKTAGKEE